MRDLSFNIFLNSICTTPDLLPPSKKVSDLPSGLWCLHVLPVNVWVFSKSCMLSYVNSKLPLGVGEGFFPCSCPCHRLAVVHGH